MNQMIQREPYGVTADGRQVTLFRICNSTGSYAEVLDYGCTVLSMCVRQRDGRRRNVISAVGSLPALAALGGTWGSVTALGRELPNLWDTVWEASEGEDDSVVFTTRPPEAGGRLALTVRVRMKDHDRLVLDYAVETQEECSLELTHRLCFCMNGEDVESTHKMRVFARQETGEDGQLRPASEEVSPMEYRPVRKGRHCYAAAGEEIHPFVELAADSNDLVLTAYARTEAMEMETAPEGAWFTARELTPPALQPGQRRESRTVYGMDLLYHPGDGLAANPFMMFQTFR